MGPEMAVTEVVSDFDRAIWCGIEDVFPSVKMYASAFHWTQTVFRRLRKSS
jgi:hypothetical protein